MEWRDEGRKGSTDEGGVRSPLLVRWPGHVRPGTKVTQIAGAIDLLPTLADLAGIPVASSRPLDGVSLAPLLRGDPSTGWPARLIFSHWNGNVSVRSQQYRLDAAGRLYDMTVDPGQQNDIAKDKPEIAAQLKEAVARWSQELLPGLRNDDRPFPVGYRAFPITWLPGATGWPMVTSSGRGGSQLLFLYQLDEHGRLDHLGRAGDDGRPLQGRGLLHGRGRGYGCHARTGPGRSSSPGQGQRAL